MSLPVLGAPTNPAVLFENVVLLIFQVTEGLFWGAAS